MKTTALAAMVWVMMATVFMGAVVMAILSVPALAGQSMTYIPIGAGVAALVAIPIAAMIARRIVEATRS